MIRLGLQEGVSSSLAAATRRTRTPHRETSTSDLGDGRAVRGLADLLRVLIGSSMVLRSPGAVEWVCRIREEVHGQVILPVHDRGISRPFLSAHCMRLQHRVSDTYMQARNRANTEDRVACRVLRAAIRCLSRACTGYEMEFESGGFDADGQATEQHLGRASGSAWSPPKRSTDLGSSVAKCVNLLGTR